MPLVRTHSLAGLYEGASLQSVFRTSRQATAWVIKVIAREWRTPVFQHLYQTAILDMRSEFLLR